MPVRWSRAQDPSYIRVQTFHFRWTQSSGFDGCLCVEAGLWKPRFHHEEINASKLFISDEHSLAVSMNACALKQDTRPILQSHDVCNFGKCLHLQTTNILWKHRFDHGEISAFKHFIFDEQSLAVSMDACALKQGTRPILHSRSNISFSMNTV